MPELNKWAAVAALYPGLKIDSVTFLTKRLIKIQYSRYRLWVLK